MGTRRTPLPVELAGATFSVVRAGEVGVSPKRLRGSDLVVPTRGVRRRVDAPASPVLLAKAFALALPDDVVFSHLTAARLHGLPTPSPWPGTCEPLDTMRQTDRPPLTRSGCRPHRGLESRTVVDLGGLRVTSVLDTWCDLSTVWAAPHLLAAADVILRRGLATPEDLERAARSRGGRRGVGRLVEAAVLARPGSASPAESLTRHRFWTWGLPEPELNAAVLDAHGGWLATVDFLWRRQRVVGEYDGDVHRTDRRAWQRDRTRRAGLEDEAWTYVEMTAPDLTDPRASARLRRRLERLVGQDPGEGWPGAPWPRS